MKKLIYIFLLLVITLSTQAQDNRFENANRLYSEAKFEEAITAYEDILKSGVENKAVYFNLGNAYYKVGNLPKSILNYERAKLLDPDDPDILYNLELANSHTVDKIEKVGQFFLKNWMNTLINKGTSDFWSIISIAAFISLLISISVFLFTKSSILKRTSFYIGILLLIIVVASFDFAYIQKKSLTDRNQGIVFAPSVTVKSSPDNSGTEIFVVHEGTKVTILESLGNWNKIQLNDGSQGWLPDVSIEII